MMMMKMKRKIFYIRRIASFWIHNRKNGKKMKKIVYSKWKIFKNSNSDSKKKEKQKKKKIKMEKWTKNGKLFSSWHVQNKIFGKCECQYQVMVWLRWFPRLAPLICCPLCSSVNREWGRMRGWWWFSYIYSWETEASTVHYSAISISPSAGNTTFSILLWRVLSFSSAETLADTFTNMRWALRVLKWFRNFHLPQFQDIYVARHAMGIRRTLRSLICDSRIWLFLVRDAERLHLICDRGLAHKGGRTKDILQFHPTDFERKMKRHLKMKRKNSSDFWSWV